MKRLGLAHPARGFALLAFAMAAVSLAQADEKAAVTPAPISYYKQIRPIFQANCQGCHQPAKAGGKYVMTAFDRLLAGGESETAAIIAGKPAESPLVELITPKNGEADMPKGKKPLAEAELELIQSWIAQGAKDDTPDSAKSRYDVDHPPLYARPPVITSIDFSPDGQLLAVAGFHEVLLIKADTYEVAGRLIGASERIESVRFSPDGKKLAVVGGLPARMGEVQVWDVAKRELVLAQPVAFDTVYGGSWSPDGTKIAFGCADNTVRAIDATTGEQVLFQGAHTDWVHDTAWSVDGSHLVSVGRDMTVKLTEVATQRFIDNVTSITPGALKGGLTSIVRHPKLDHIVVGGSDGLPKAYRIFREAKRVIGDDANLLFELFPLKGRVFSVVFSEDGKRLAAASSLDGQGEVVVCSYDFTEDAPAHIKNIMGKVPGTRSADERKAMEEYKKSGVKELARIPLAQSGGYAVTFRPDGQSLAVAGADGIVRLFDANTGGLQKEFSPAPISEAAPAVVATTAIDKAEEAIAEETLPADVQIAEISVEPKELRLGYRFERAQFLITAKLVGGGEMDVTRVAEIKASAPLVEITRSGYVKPIADGTGTVSIKVANQTANIPLQVVGVGADYHPDFIRDVNPLLSRMGCNQGTCHGSAKGRNGFKLSLRGYDPLFDVREFTDDLASRRVNVASPDDSLMLLKPTTAVAHEGGRTMEIGEPYYAIVRSWIADGAKLDLAAPRVTKIEVLPHNPVVPKIGARQQIRVIATFADGVSRDVTREAFIETGNAEVATSSRTGLMTAIRRGEAPILARYEGSYAATTLTVMGDRTGFVWEQPETWGQVDELVASKWQRMKIRPSALAGDAEFLRRVYLDLTGLPPTADQVRAFLEDPRETRVKRDEIVEKLVGSEPYVDYWTNKWADLLQVNRKFLGAEGAAAFRAWIRTEVANNTPYDEFAMKILTATGSNKDNPAASYFKILRDSTTTMENTTHLFLAVRFNCNKCHDHPFERWTQDQYYQTSAYFAQFDLATDPASGDKRIGGTAVEGAKPLYEIVKDKNQGDIKHERTGAVVPPQFPYPCEYETKDGASRREQLAAWITSPDNQYFARSYVNRLWGYLLGVGIIEPIDDIRAGNPASNPELLDYLTKEFIEHDFDVRHVIKLIAKSRVYQLSVETNDWNKDDKINYSHALARRLPAEVLYDTVIAVTGASSQFPGVPAGTRAASLPDSGVELPSGFLSTFGRPTRESACECERSSGLQLGPVMALISGPTIASAINDPKNVLPELVKSIPEDGKLVNEIFMRILNRPASPAEVEGVAKILAELEGEHQQLVAALAAREAEVAPIRAAQEKEREEAIAKTKAELEAHAAAIKPRIEMEEKKRLERVAKLEEDFKKYGEQLPAKQAEWEAERSAGLWTVVKPTKLEATGGVKLTQQEDGSITAVEKKGKSIYTLTFETDQPITGFRLEAIPDPKLPVGGPGLAPDGNFVLNEFEVQATAKSDPAKLSGVKLQRPLADFSQEKFPIAQTIDGTKNAVNGWAVSPTTGVVHWATWECAQPIQHEGGSTIKIMLHQQFNTADFLLGRFRIAVTTAPLPIGLTLPEDLRAALAVPAEARKPEQKEVLSQYYRKLDPGVRSREQALASARQPLPIDPKLKELQETLAFVSQPVPEDAKLTQLKQDVEQSKGQLANSRLTMAQDLTWALINSPAFLFNH